jgi:hypothetical protein
VRLGPRHLLHLLGKLKRVQTVDLGIDSCSLVDREASERAALFHGTAVRAYRIANGG